MQTGVREGNGRVLITTYYECSYGCSDCSYGSKCTACRMNYYKYTDTNSKISCFATCPDGTKPNENDQTCINCSISLCSKCQDSENTCTECQKGFRLYENKCLQDCPIGARDESTKCTKCNSNCDECPSDSNVCTKCSSTYKLYNNECLLNCPEGTAEQKSQCINCAVKNCFNCDISKLLNP